MVPGGERLWCKGLQPALQVTPDSGGLWMQFYECEAYYWAAVAHFADALATIDPAEGARLRPRRRPIARTCGGGGTLHRAFAGGPGARRHVPFGHPVCLLCARVEHGRLGLETRRLRQACRPPVLGNGPVGGGADQSGGIVAPRRCAGAGIPRRAGGSVAPGECICRHRSRELVPCRLAVSGRTGTHLEHAPGGRRHSGLPPLVPERLRH